MVELSNASVDGSSIGGSPFSGSPFSGSSFDNSSVGGASAKLLSRRTKSGVVATRVGLVVAVLLAILYAYLGSLWSGVGIGLIAFAIAATTFLLPDSVPLSLVAGMLIGLTWVVSWFVCYRTGGIASPAIVWSFFHPLTAYLVMGRRWAVGWMGLSAAHISVFVVVRELNWGVAHDLSPTASNALRTSGFIVCIFAVALVIIGAESVRNATQHAVDEATRTLERQRILTDMHDGLGSQLLGLMIQVRAKRIDDERLLQGLTACMDDLKLIVDSLDPAERTFETAVGELRARIEPRCEAAGIELKWTVEPGPPHINAERTLQVLRALQEMTTNALRHSGTKTMHVSLGRVSESPGLYEVSVRDFGNGIDPKKSSSSGRGMTSLKTRAQRLGGEFAVGPDPDASQPGTTARICFPLVETRTKAAGSNVRRIR